MFHTKVVLSTLLGACALFVSAAVAAPVSNDQPSASSAFQTVLQPDLTLKTSFSSSLVPQAADHLKGGFCHCGCGIRCETSADCGGAACQPFITCCARGGEPSDTVPFQLGKSTRTGEVGPLPNTKCK